MSTQLFGNEHPHVLTAANNLARDLFRLGEYAQAAALDEEVLSRSRQILGPDHPDTFGAAINLAADLRALGRNDEARSLEDAMAAWRGSS